MRQHGAGNGQKPEDIGAVDRLDFLSTRFLDGAKQAETGIVDQNIDAAEAGNRGLGGIMGLALVVDIECDGEKVG